MCGGTNISESPLCVSSSFYYYVALLLFNHLVVEQMPWFHLKDTIRDQICELLQNKHAKDTADFRGPDHFLKLKAIYQFIGPCTGKDTTIAHLALESLLCLHKIHK